MLKATDTAIATDTPVPTVEPDRPSIHSIAEQALKKGGKNILRATAAMEKMVRNDLGIYRLLMDPLVRNACYQAVSSLHRRDNGKCWHTAQPSESDERSRVVALSSGTAASLLNFTINGGTRLGDAVVEDLEQAIHFYRSQSQDMGIKAAWLSLIRERLPEGKTVKQAFKEKQLAALKREASE